MVLYSELECGWFFKDDELPSEAIDKILQFETNGKKLGEVVVTPLFHIFPIDKNDDRVIFIEVSFKNYRMNVSPFVIDPIEALLEYEIDINNLAELIIHAIPDKDDIDKIINPFCTWIKSLDGAEDALKQLYFASQTC